MKNRLVEEKQRFTMKLVTFNPYFAFLFPIDHYIMMALVIVLASPSPYISPFSKIAPLFPLNHSLIALLVLLGPRAMAYRASIQ